MNAAFSGNDRPSRRPTSTRTLILTLLAVAAFRLTVSGIAPVLDPTEGRYSEIASSMARTGDWVTPRLWVDGEQVPFLGKPPLFFWTAALSIRVFGANEFAVRLPSFVAAVSLLLLMFFVLGRFYGRDVAASAVLMTSTSALFFFLAGSVVVDMHLAFFVAGSLLAFLAYINEPDEPTKKNWILLIFLLLAGGFLSKGPVALVLFGAPVLLWTVWTGSWRLFSRHGWIAGMALFAVLVAPWFIVAEIRNPGFLRYFFINENLLRYLKPVYGDLYGTGHHFPRGSAILMFIAGALPWSVVALWRVATRRWALVQEILRDDVQCLLFLGVAANVVFWCFARQLLPTYMAPMVPLLASWLAVNLRNDEKAVRTGNRLALAAVIMWFGLLVTAVPASSGDSTREVLNHAKRVAWELNVPFDVTFANHTTQSALFYAPDTVHDHPREPVGKTVQRLLDSGRRRLLIIREDDLEHVSAALQAHLLKVDESDGWLLFVTRVDSVDPALTASRD